MNQEVDEASPVHLKCETTSADLDVCWYKNDVPLTGEQGYTIVQTGTVCQMEIHKAELADNANFSCVIHQSKARTAAKVTVLGERLNIVTDFCIFG